MKTQENGVGAILFCMHMLCLANDQKTMNHPFFSIYTFEFGYGPFKILRVHNLNFLHSIQ